jgi:hypothetical protein
MRLLPPFLIALGAAGPALAGACDAPLAAAMKMSTIPYRMQSVTTSGVGNAADTASTPSEMVATADKMYIHTGGSWHAMARPKDLSDAITAAMQEGSVGCSKTGAETIDGAATSVYQIETPDDEDIKSQTVWIADDTQLMVKAEFQLDVGGGDAGKSSTTATFSYTDVTPPPGVN